MVHAPVLTTSNWNESSGRVGESRTKIVFILSVGLMSFVDFLMFAHADVSIGGGGAPSVAEMKTISRQRIKWCRAVAARLLV
jgi:hypothetical protein